MEKNSDKQIYNLNKLRSRKHVPSAHGVSIETEERHEHLKNLVFPHISVRYLGGHSMFRTFTERHELVGVDAWLKLAT